MAFWYLLYQSIAGNWNLCQREMWRGAVGAKSEAFTRGGIERAAAHKKKSKKQKIKAAWESFEGASGGPVTAPGQFAFSLLYFHNELHCIDFYVIFSSLMAQSPQFVEPFLRL